MVKTSSICPKFALPSLLAISMATSLGSYFLIGRANLNGNLWLALGFTLGA